MSLVPYVRTSVAEFHAACGGTAPMRLAATGADGGESGLSAEFPKPYVVVGTGPNVDVDLSGLASEPLPARAVYFQILTGHVFATPLTTAVPVLLNGQPLEPGWVGPADAITVGGVRVRAWNPGVQPGDVPGPNPCRRRPDAAYYYLERQFAADGPELVAGRRLVWLIGRESPARLQIPVPDLAPVHAALMTTPTGVWVLNLAADGGLTINGDVVSFARLTAGLRVGFAGREFGFHTSVPTGSGSYLAMPTPASPNAALPPAATAADMTVMLNHITKLQEQSFEQFQKMLTSVMQMFGTVMTEQREFMEAELDRMERLIQDASAKPVRTKAGPPTVRVTPPADPASPPPRRTALGDGVVPLGQAPALPAAAPRTPDADAKLHSWVQQQLTGLQQNQGTLWQRLKDRLTGG